MDTIYICNEFDKKEVLDLTIEKNTNINIFNQKLKKINIKVLDNVLVNLNEFNTISSDTTEIIFSIKNHSTLTYNLSNIIDNNYKLNIKINYEGNNSKVETNIHSIVKGEETINLIGTIKNECKNNELLEQVKVMLIENGKCEVNPDMAIATNEVVANHKVAISNIRDKELFYLMSKGLSENTANNLIKRSFLISNITNDELKSRINNYL